MVGRGGTTGRARMLQMQAFIQGRPLSSIVEESEAPSPKGSRERMWTDQERRKIKEDLCDGVASGKTLAAQCRDAHMPTTRTVRNWLRTDPIFRQKMEDARMMMADLLLDRQLDLIDPEVTKIERRTDGSWDPGHVQWVRNAIATLQWLSERWAPKKYGALLKVVGDKSFDPVQMTDTEVSHKLSVIMEAVRQRRLEKEAKAALESRDDEEIQQDEQAECPHPGETIEYGDAP